MRKPGIDQKISLTIMNLGINGEGVGFWHDLTIFVDGALPGEVVAARVFSLKRNFARAKLISVVKKAKNRQKPVCQKFTLCGGCHLMHLPYEEQLKIKRGLVTSAFVKFAKEDPNKVLPCIRSFVKLHYRNKIQCPLQNFDNRPVMGFFSRNSIDLIDIEHCHLHNKLGEKILNNLKTILCKYPIKAYDKRNCQGELRHILIKASEKTNQALVVFVVQNEQVKAKYKSIASDLIIANPELKGALLNINNQEDNRILGEKFLLLRGEEYIEEYIGDLKYRVSAASFFQINVLQAENLYTQALKYARLEKDQTALDAYCGVGSLSLWIAKHAHKVIAVENVLQAVEDAKVNAKNNNIQNIEFVCGQIENYIDKIKNVDVVFVNPPRRGCETIFLKALTGLSPKKIIYISCNPVTQAKDYKYLKDFGYTLTQCQPFDMFPQTIHVENVALFERK